MKKISLVLGGNGFLGHHILSELVKRQIKVRSIVRQMPDSESVIPDVEYIVGDAFSHFLLKKALLNVDKVYCFVSTSMPNAGELNLNNEIEVTLKSLDSILYSMVKANVKTIIFPSSGGAIYGDHTTQLATETTPLLPKTAYGVGKQMSENLLGFYHRKYGMNILIFRIGNVYGSHLLREKPQGVIDVFTQSALLNQPIRVWGDASKSIRDFIYMDDAIKAIVDMSLKEIDGVNVYNVGTGIGESIETVISILKRVLNKNLNVEYIPQKTSGVSHIVLDSRKLQSIISWRPEVDLYKGIEMTIETKKKLLKNFSSSKR